ncbi:TPA: phage head-binding domain-containing protein [Salmonella enterica subsp. enterica serovar Waycross]
MTDITANVVIGMPSQLFTMARSFKAVTNGKIYIGQIDTDPTNPANQIQVYVENEDGSHVSVSQPIVINSAGYPVYNGQIAKFVTVQGHSMAVYDAYGAQQFYYPNVLKYDPDQLRQQLASSEDGKGDNLVAVKQPVSNAKDRTVHDWLSDIITAKEGENIIADGVNNDAVGINAFLPVLVDENRELLLVPGIYLVNDDITIDIPVTFQPGAIIKPRNGAQLTFNSEIRAGCYKIFDTEDDFYTSPVAVPSVKIAKGGVKPEWFGAATVSSYDEIASSVDCSPAFMKAWRATTGEYTSNVTASYRQSEYMHSYIELSSGKYRMDREVFLGHTDFTPTTVRYNKNGGGVIGKGSCISVLVFTDGSYTGNAFFSAVDMSGEMHEFRSFKCAFYDPSKVGDEMHQSKAGAMMLFSTIDSLTTSDIWASGAKLVVSDPSGFGRGGVGVQFDSVVDHHFNNILVEHCAHGCAFSSCISTGVNVKGFRNTLSDLSFGNMIPAWPDIISQHTKNIISIYGFESKSNSNSSITFGTNDNNISINGVVVDGRAESSSNVITKLIITFATGGGCSGNISGCVDNVLYGLINDGGSAQAGRPGGTLNLDFVINNVTGSSSSENAVVILDKTDSCVIMSLSVNESTFPAIINRSSNLTSSLNISNMNLTSPVSGYRPIISKGGNVTITSISITNTTTITDLAYVENSTLLLPAMMITPVTSVSKGSGGVVKTNQLIDY